MKEKQGRKIEQRRGKGATAAVAFDSTAAILRFRIKTCGRDRING